MTVHEALIYSTDELCRRVRDHHDLLNQAMRGGDAPLRMDERLLLDCPHKRRFQETLLEIIEVLEVSKKAFKSKQLETLRKKLIGVLAEIA